MVCEVHVLCVGYSGPCDEGMRANCSCTLIRGRKNIIVDTMTPWDKEKILAGLAKFRLTPNDIDVVVSTHGHSDHIGNNNLFLNAKHIVGYSVSYEDIYCLHPFEEGEPYFVSEDVKIIPTPGHTNADVSVIVRTADLGIVAVVGDLFEREEDIADPTLWRVIGGSENPKSQEKYRNEMLMLADYVIPGHGPMFAVTPGMRVDAQQMLNSIASSRHPIPMSPNMDSAQSLLDEGDRRNQLPSPNRSHRASVWEGRLGPSNEWEERHRRLGPEAEPLIRDLPDRDRLPREPWDERDRPPLAFSAAPRPPVPLLDDETIKRLEHKRARDLSGSWDERHLRDYIGPSDGRWPDMDGERSRGERGEVDGLRNATHGDQMGREATRMSLNDRLPRDERPNRDGRLGRGDRLSLEERFLNHSDLLRRNNRMERDDRPIRDERLNDRPFRNERPLRDESRPMKEERSNDRPLRDERYARDERPNGRARDERPRNLDSCVDNTADKDFGVPNSRFNIGKVRNDRQDRMRRDPGGWVRGGDRPDVSRESKDAGPVPSRRDDGIRREGRGARRPGDDRIPRLREDRPRRDARPREDDFPERNVRLKPYDGPTAGRPRFHP